MKKDKNIRRYTAAELKAEAGARPGLIYIGLTLNRTKNWNG